MKYKGIELAANTEAEFLVNVKIFDDYYSDIEEAEVTIFEMVEDHDWVLEYIPNVYIEQITDTELQVRCDDIDFSVSGVRLLEELFDLLDSNNTLRVSIGIHVDAEKWFENENGHEYNEDIAETWKEFKENLEM